MQTAEHKQENGIVNILVNIAIPVLVLKKLSVPLGPLYALFIAIAFPISYGIYDLNKKKKINYFSVLGMINIAITGTLAALHLDGMWFSVKEAAFPLLIGTFVFVNSFSKEPLIKTLLLNPQIMHLEKVNEVVSERQKHHEFSLLLKKSTQLFALTFVFSAILNFVLALYIFTPIDPSLDGTAHTTLLNEQIAKMTTTAFMVILVPSMLMMFAILFYLLRGLQNLTGLTRNEILKN